MNANEVNALFAVIANCDAHNRFRNIRDAAWNELTEIDASMSPKGEPEAAAAATAPSKTAPLRKRA